MRLIFINRYFFPDHSATSQLLSDLAFFLAAQGCAVTVITSRQRYDAPAAGLAAVETAGGVEIRRIWTTRFGRAGSLGRLLDYLTFCVSAAWQLGHCVSRGDLLVAKTDPPMISVIAALVAKWRGAALATWCQDLFPEVAAALGVWPARGPVGAALRALRNASLRRAAVNVVPGERMAAHLEAQGIAAERVRVIHNWSDGARIRPLPAAANPLREAWGLGGKFVVGYAGNFGRAHDFGTILDAATALRERQDIVFLLIGDGARRDWVEQRVAQRGLGNVLLKPYQPGERLFETLSVPDLHVVSLRPELEGLILPSKFYGIAAAGRPTLFVGDPDGEIASILEREGCGYSVALGDSAGARGAIESLAADPELCGSLGRNARAAFERDFDKPVALERWRKLLLDVPAP